MRDPVVQQAPYAFQKFNARVAKMIARHFRPAAFQQWARGETEKTTRPMHVIVRNAFLPSGLIFHIRSPSFRRSESYSPTWRGWGKGRPCWWEARCDAAESQPAPPGHRPF